MDFGNGQSAINDAISAANATSGQLAGLYGISTTAAFNMMSLTPIAGQNDDNEFFSQGDAQTLETYAAQHGVAGLSFWEVDAFDKPVGFNYSRIFNAITGGGSPPPPPPPPGNGTPIHGFGGKCVDVAGANSADGTQVQLFTCNGTNAQSWTHTGSTYQALGKCLDVQGAGTANGTRVQLFTCNGTGAQSWTHTASNQLVNTNSGKCLDATGVSSADGTPLQIWSCSGGANQVWTGP
jgi:chitinase